MVLALVLDSPDLLAMLQCFHVLPLLRSCSCCLNRGGLIFRLAISAGILADFLVWCFLAAHRSSVLVAAVLCRCSSLLSLVLSLCPVLCVARVDVLLHPLVFSLALLLSLLFPGDLEVIGQFFSCLSEFFLQFFFAIAPLCSASSCFICFSAAFSCWVFLEMCAEYILLLPALRMLLLLFRFFSCAFLLGASVSLVHIPDGLFLSPHSFLLLFLFLRSWR